MLQRLELADRHAELLARLQVFVGGLGQRLDDAERFGAQRGAGKLRRVLDIARRSRIGQHRIAATRTPSSVTSAARKPSTVP
jgi:hypothetical protein